jgi:selenoprotein W-related protein
LAAALRDRWPTAEVGLIPSGGGAFEVVVDGALVFSKKELGRHAQPGEVLRLIAERTAGTA